MTMADDGQSATKDGQMQKTELLKLIQELPETIDLDQLLYTLYFRREVERGLADADAGHEVSLDEIDALIDEWSE